MFKRHSLRGLPDQATPATGRVTGSAPCGRRRRKSTRPCALTIEGLEDRNLLSFSAPASFHFNREPVAVATADFTGSGSQDLIVSDDVGQTLTLLRGNGDGTFRNTGSFQAGGEAVLAAGDFNGDGIPDLVQGTGAGVRLLLGNGDGTFRNGASLAFSSGFTSSIAVGDFDGDGRLDLIVASTREGDPQAVFELRGNGDGTFQAPIDLGFRANFVVAGDVDGDGRLDLIDGNSASGSAELRRGNGDGTFQPPVSFAPGLPLTVTDVNGDGIADLVFATRTGITERLGNGDGTFQPPVAVNLPADVPAQAILGVGDFNQDGQLDVVIQNRAFEGQAHALSVLLNNGDGTFAAAPAFVTGANQLAVAAGAFTDSGLPDLVTVGFDHLAHVLLNNGDGTFRNGPALSAPGVGESVVTGDFNGDGQLDIAVFSRDAIGADSVVDVFLGNGDGTFRPAQVFDLGPNTESTFGKVVAGDFDADGRLDLAVLFDDNSVDINRRSFVEVLLGNGDGSFRAAARRQVGEFNDASGLAAADFNGDGRLDLVVTHGGDAFGSGSVVSVLRGNGDGSFQDPAIIPVPGNPFAVAVGDFNGDGIPDVVTANSPNLFSPGTVSVLLGRGDGTFAAPVNYQVGVVPGAVIVGDFEGNGVLDIAVTNSFSNSVSVLRGNGDGTFRGAVDYLVGVDPRSLVAADFNGDGALDLAVANDHSNDLSVLLNRADGAGAGTRAAASHGRPDGSAAGLAQAARLDAFYTGVRAESLKPAVIGRQPPVAAGDGALVGSRRTPAVPPVVGVPAGAAAGLPHPLADVRAGADNAELADPLAFTL